MKREKQKIFVVDDHPIVRMGLQQIISLENDLVFCGEASSANEAITKIARVRPDLVIVDISLDGDMSGFDLLQALHERYRDMLTLVISMYEETFYVDRAIRSGARGYVAKKYAYSTIIDAIRKVLGGEIYLSSTASQKLIQSMYHHDPDSALSSASKLSKREFEIFQMLGNGLDSSQITKKLGISANTVQTHKRHIKEKLGIQNNSQLVRQAMLFFQKQ